MGRDPGRGRNRIAKALTALAVMLMVVVFVDTRIRPVVEDMLEYETAQNAFQIINTSMLRELEADAVSYDEMVRIDRSVDGAVTSIQTDMMAVNLLKARTAETVAQVVGERENQTLSIPVGTLLGNAIVSGRGPVVEIKVIPVGYVESELYNRFTSAGINQTLHQIMLKTKVQMIAVMPGFSVRTQATTSFCVAETVIVGAIPEGYTIVGEDNRSGISKAYDYRAEIS